MLSSTPVRPQDFCECGPVMTEAEYHTPLHPEIARAYFRDVLMGLEYLHFQRVIHRCVGHRSADSHALLRLWGRETCQH
jgi:hypothetical protein